MIVNRTIDKTQSIFLIFKFQACFAVTAITGIKKRKYKQTNSAESTTSTEQTEGSQATVSESNGQDNEEEEWDKVYPGISLWVAFQVPACLLAKKEQEVLSLLQTCGFSVFEAKVRIKNSSLLYIREIVVHMLSIFKFYCSK